MEAEDEAGVNGSMAKISSRMGRERGISGYHFLQMAFLSFYERNCYIPRIVNIVQCLHYWQKVDMP